MPIDWLTLRDAGVPLGATRAVASAVDPSSVRLALEGAGASFEELHEDERVALAAWLAGLRHHWPLRFQRLAGPAGETLLLRLREGPIDLNRYLKLRRIAIERLAWVVERVAA